MAKSGCGIRRCKMAYLSINIDTVELVRVHLTVLVADQIAGLGKDRFRLGKPLPMLESGDSSPDGTCLAVWTSRQWTLGPGFGR